ncbi:MAG: potassium-transporting ATPase subunit KdpB [Vampirovibrionales bacterium]|nr:potassium-transporting ATPase subunit KdpB [Vampirovibrionales bacterium]
MQNPVESIESFTVQRNDRKHKPAMSNQSLILQQALTGMFTKLDPRLMIKNPVMFVVEIGFLLTLVMSFQPQIFGPTLVTQSYVVGVMVILFVTLLFANFAEAYAEGRGKAQADSLKKTRSTTQARLILADGTEKLVGASDLRAGNIVRVTMGEIIPSDGEVMEGIASADESAITGESAPVIKEPGTDMASSVTGGTKVLSDYLLIKITSNPGESFLDKMVALVEGAKRQKTPNEIALTVLLAALTLVFLMVCVTLVFYAGYSKSPLDTATLIALLVCLIPTTIGALLSAIGIAGMDRVSRFNVIAMSGKAVEASGDIGVLILDKTGTITLGNRLASEFIPVAGKTVDQLARMAACSSLDDTTPEGKSIVELAKRLGVTDLNNPANTTSVEFSAETRSSGVDWEDGTRVRKGAMDAIKRFILDQGWQWSSEAQELAEQVARQGGTPLVVACNTEVYGVIHLKDIIKPGMAERFAQMRTMGIKTIMCTGDNPITAEVIAREAGVDDFVAEAKPEDKIALIKKYQSQGLLVAMTGDGTNDAPALAQADVGLAMNSGTQAAKEAANMIDLDSDPSKLIDVVSIGKQLLITRGALTTFSVANDIAKYFAIIPAIFIVAIPAMKAFDIMGLGSADNAILSALIFNAVIIPLLIPLALKGVQFKPMSANQLLTRNILIYGLGGIIAPFIGIKAISLALNLFGL